MRTLTRALVVATCLVASSQPLQAQVSDARYGALARRLFPTIDTIRADELSAETRQMLNVRRERIDACRVDTRCILLNSLWKEEEIALLARTAEGKLTGGVQAGRVADDGVAAQVTREVVGLNSILQIYGLGTPSRNPEIDGPLFKIGATPFAARVSDAVAISGAGEVETELDTSVALALALLDVNGRTDAAAFEPLDAKLNAGALKRARSVDWKDYQYSAIVVLGNGPELTGEVLSPRAKLRVRVAASRFTGKVAPFIIVTGGAVHPRGTTINEAVEMQRALVEWYGIPEDKIIVEPYARYTYTNLSFAFVTTGLFTQVTVTDTVLPAAYVPSSSVAVALMVKLFGAEV